MLKIGIFELRELQTILMRGTFTRITFINETTWVIDQLPEDYVATYVKHKNKLNYKDVFAILRFFEVQIYGKTSFYFRME